MRFFILFLLIGACSHQPQEVEKKADLLKDCLFKEVGQWEDTVHNFDCISKISHSVDALLKQGNSPQAVRLSRIGYDQYPFDDRIKNQFYHSVETYKAVTRKLTDCHQIKERVLFLRAVSPDTDFEIEACPVPKELNRVVVEDVTALRANKLIEVGEYKNISGQVKYMVKKNTEDNFENILYKGLESVDVIHQSTHFDVSDATDENNFTLKVHTKVLMDQKIDETCQELSQVYNFREGQSFPCGVKMKSQLWLGKVDFDHLKKLHDEGSLIYGFIPTVSVFLVEFHYAKSTTSFYYLDTATDNDRYLKLDDKTPALSGVKTKNGFTYGFENISSNQVEGLKSISLSFNRLLTFKTYAKASKTNKPIQDVWMGVVKENSILK